MDMDRDKRFYWDLFIATFQLSMFTLGGGFVIVPLMRKKFMEEKHWIDEEEMMDFTAIAQSAPGSMAVNASILVGYRLAGITGVLVTVLGTVLPPLIILTVVSVFYGAFKSNAYVAMAMKGMQACVAAIIIDVAMTMGKGVLAPRKWLPCVILSGSFLAVFFFGVNVFIVIIVCGAIGAIDTMYGERLRKLKLSRLKHERRKRHPDGDGGR